MSDPLHRDKYAVFAEIQHKQYSALELRKLTISHTESIVKNFWW